MTLRAAARSIEVLLARLGITGLQILRGHSTPPPWMRFRGRLARVDECDNAANLRRRKVEGGHLVVGSALADHAGNLLAGRVGKHHLRLRQVRAGLATHRVAAMTECAILAEKRATGLGNIRRLTVLLAVSRNLWRLRTVEVVQQSRQFATLQFGKPGHP